MFYNVINMHKNKEELKAKIIKEYQNVGLFRRIFSWKDIMSNIENEIDKLDISFDNSEIIKDFEATTKEADKLRNELSNLNVEKDALNKQLGSIEEQLTTTNKQMLEYTKEIHNIFNSSSGKQGKISERRLKEVLIATFGIESDIWMENLPVDKHRVEFAFKINLESDKWVPVDSKSYIPKTDDNGEFIIDSSYVNQIKSAGEEIAKKYINKDNTEPFGLLVLPSESVYVEVMNLDSGLYQTLADKRVHVTSPLNFIQFVQTVGNLNNKLEAVAASENIINEISTAFSHMVDFYNATKTGVDKLNMAFDKHMNNANKKLTSVKDSLDSTKKIN